MKIFYYHTSDEQLLPKEVAEQTVTGLIASGEDVSIAGDLCSLVVEDPASISGALEADWIISPYQVAAVEALLSHAGVEQIDPARIICHRDRCSCSVLSEVLGTEVEINEQCLKDARELLDKLKRDPDSWRPWFPVIHRARCTGCNQCAGFCLFGVYEVIDQQVKVTNPDKCRDNCPACARVCPAEAVIFPMFPDPPINGGQGSGEQPTRLDPAKLIDGDVMEKLRQRGQDKVVRKFLGDQSSGKDCQC